MDGQVGAVAYQAELRQAFFREPFLSPSPYGESSAIPR